MEKLQSPADLPIAAWEVGKNVLRFVSYQMAPGWDSLPADPNGASITIYESPDYSGVGIPERPTRSRAA